VEQVIRRGLNGPSRYTPEVLSQLLGQARLTAEGGVEAQQDALDEDLARRGVARSGVGAEASRLIRQNAANQVSATSAQLTQSKIEADYQDKVTAIQQALDHVNSLRSYTLQSQSNAYQRDAQMANIRLAYDQIANAMREAREARDFALTQAEQQSSLGLMQFLLTGGAG
jgi:hypothetical protein